MDKRSKRLKKTLIKKPTNALVVGGGFLYLDAILEIFDSVFLHCQEKSPVKHKKIIYRKDIKSCTSLNAVSTVFIDRDHLRAADLLTPLMHNPSPDFIFEGKEPISRDWSVGLYSANYGCTVQGPDFHIWERLK